MDRGIEMLPLHAGCEASDVSSKSERGLSNLAFEMELAQNGLEQNSQSEGDLPPLSYVDFVPKCLGCRLQGGDPEYATFRSVVDQANDWLRSAPTFRAVKCETVEHKLSRGALTVNTDACLLHVSSQGRNVYLRGVRLWLMPNNDRSSPVQELAYITVLPDHKTSSLITALRSTSLSEVRTHPERVLRDFDDQQRTVEKLNHHLSQRPLPGRILCIETLTNMAKQSDSNETLQTESCLAPESGKASRLYLYAFRIFYILGQPSFESIGFKDHVPDFYQNGDDFGLGIKFAPFSQTVERAGDWLKKQQNVRIVSIQTITTKAEKNAISPFYHVDSYSAGFSESPSLTESRYVRVLRMFFVKDRKAVDVPLLHASIQLTSRLFVPNRIGYREFQTSSASMRQVVRWLAETGSAVLDVETIRYPVSHDICQPINEDRVDSVVNSNTGQLNVVCIRLYLPCHVKEPPPKDVLETYQDGWGWYCVLS